MKKTLLTVLCISLIAIGAAGCGNTGSSTQSTTTTNDQNAITTTAAETTTEVTTTEAPKNNELKIGEAGTLSDWEITVSSSEAMDSIKQKYGSFKPEEGNKFLVVEMSVKNAGTSSATFLPYIATNDDVQIHLKYKDYTFSSTNLLAYDEDLHNKVLNPLSSATGICAFDVAPEVADSNEIQLVIECGKQSIVYNLSK